MSVPSESVYDAARAVYGDGFDGSPHKEAWLVDFRKALEAAYPSLLSHEREQTRLAHLDAMVNRETKRAELEKAWHEGWDASTKWSIYMDMGGDEPDVTNPYGGKP